MHQQGATKPFALRLPAPKTQLPISPSGALRGLALRLDLQHLAAGDRHLRGGPIDRIAAGEAVDGGLHRHVADAPEHVFAAGRQAGVIEEGIGLAAGLRAGLRRVVAAAGQGGELQRAEDTRRREDVWGIGDWRGGPQGLGQRPGESDQERGRQERERATAIPPPHRSRRDGRAGHAQRCP